MSVVVPPPGEYLIDPAESQITFRAKHQFGTGTVRGSFALRSGTIVVAEPATGSHFTAAVDAASFASGSKGRDKKVRSATFLDVENNPDILVAASSAQHSPSGVWTVQATVTARGGSAPVEFTVTQASVDGDRLTLTVTGRVDRYAHGITKMKGMVGRYLQLTGTIVAQAGLTRQ